MGKQKQAHLPENTQNVAKKEKRGGKRSTSWEKGQSGNRRGAPRKGLSWRDLIAAIGDEIKETGKYAGMTWKEAVVRSAYVLAVNGNFLMFKALIEHGETPPPNEINLNVRDMEQVRQERLRKFAPVLAAALRDAEASEMKPNE